MTDITLRPNGSVVLFTPESTEGKSWIAENVESEGWQWLGGSLAVDRRMAEPLYEDMLNSGLSVEVL